MQRQDILTSCGSTLRAARPCFCMPRTYAILLVELVSAHSEEPHQPGNLQRELRGYKSSKFRGRKPSSSPCRLRAGRVQCRSSMLARDSTRDADHPALASWLRSHDGALGSGTCGRLRRGCSVDSSVLGKDDDPSWLAYDTVSIGINA